MMHGTISVTWKINGTYFSQLPRDIRDDLDSDPSFVRGTSRYRDVLTVPPRSQYNRTVLQCIAFGTEETVTSDSVTLLFQGMSKLCTMSHKVLVRLYYL